MRLEVKITILNTGVLYKISNFDNHILGCCDGQDNRVRFSGC